MKKATKILILLLLIDAAAVMVVLKTIGAQPLIILYWALLTIKNFLDWRTSVRKDGGK